jgi:hypothetical protein
VKNVRLANFIIVITCITHAENVMVTLFLLHVKHVDTMAVKKQGIKNI